MLNGKPIVIPDYGEITGIILLGTPVSFFPLKFKKKIYKVNNSVILTYFIIPGASGKSFYEIGNDISKIIYYGSYLKVYCKLRVLRFVCTLWQVNVLRTHSLVTMASASQKQIQNVTL